MQTQTPKLILASASPRRVELLSLLKLSFDTRPSHVDESVAPGISAEQAVLDIARRKSTACREETRAEYTDQSVIVLGADTTVALGEEMLGKPQTDAEAFEMLSKLSGGEHLVLTGVSLIASKGEEQKEFYGIETSLVKFRELQEKEIRFYIESGEPMDKAGAYAIQGLGSVFIEKITGCYTNIVGLPLPMTVGLLRQAGLPVMNCLDSEVKL
ncbi:septum formation protein Maf [bacterium]|nr:septum formation protein Maf [bacterium]